MKKIYFIFLFLLSGYGALKAQSLATNIVADNTIYSDLPNNSNGKGENVFSGTNSAASSRRIVIKFSVGVFTPLRILSSYTLTSATLKLTKNAAGNAENVGVYKLLKPFNEGTSNAGALEADGTTATLNDATWNCALSNGSGGCTSAWLVPGSDYVPVASATTLVGVAQGNYYWSSLQLMADVQGWLDDPSTNFGWVIIGDEGVASSINRFGSKQNPSIPSWPVLTGTLNIVSVNFLSFNANAGKAGNILTWQTASEGNSAFFSVQHSSDGVHFTTVGKVNAAGTSTSLRSYSFTHGNVKSGINYYRLAQTDVDGKINYTIIRSVNNKEDAHYIFISPNPATDQISLSGEAAKTGNIYTVVDGTGAVVLSGTTTADVPVNLSGLTKGYYYIRIQTKTNELLRGQFIKL